MRRILLVAAALLAQISTPHSEAAAQVQHSVFGMAEAPGYQVTFPDGARDTLGTGGPSGLIFESEQRGRFEIEPVGIMPPAVCANGIITSVSRTCGPALVVEFMARNVGTAASIACVIGVSWKLPGGVVQVEPNQSCPALAPGVSSNKFVVTLEPTVPGNLEGAELFICYDKSGVVTETDELDNCY